VLFVDLDNTLVDRTAGFRAWAAATLPDADPAWLDAEDRDGFQPREEFFTAVKARYGLAGSIESLVDAYRRDQPAFVPPPPAETLAALTAVRAAGWKIAIVTNGATAQQTRVAAPLLPYVDAVCISEQVGVRKPDPEIFRIAARMCGEPHVSGWMIGDSPQADIGGAVAAGLCSVWIDRGREWSEPDFAPTVIAAAVNIKCLAPFIHT
jgi:FMN phosphatase YigB (HAD superfamily)